MKTGIVPIRRPIRKPRRYAEEFKSGNVSGYAEVFYEHRDLLTRLQTSPSVVPMLQTISDGDHIQLDGQQALHAQVADKLRSFAEELGTGAKLPSEAELVQGLGVSRTTIRRAIKALTESGVLDVQHGRGTFVAFRPVTQSIDRFGPFVESLTAEGEKTTELVDSEWRTGWDVPSAIGGPDLPGFGFRWLHRINGRPHALFDCTLPVDIGQKIDRNLLATTPIYYILEEQLGIVPRAADYTFTAGPANDDVASLLNVEPASSLLILERKTKDLSGTIVECGRYFLVPELHQIRLSASATRLASVLDFDGRTS
ncbi:GntR family transcriptional regulator [Pseudarthrobacter sp. MDT3-26]|uniref:GntR family transcriptional regulator n=1 Tax=Pseudarthrobacter raffinosi TaxID=2953651 RepID=UPI00208F8C51|nr:GntR family transcriptional regulator [Pseudarthrobacter sp. MDT3-26]MCO4262512.1 GntR family transcriptional regulator [Pseudarthrobacter sp. MDT3-26]